MKARQQLAVQSLTLNYRSEPIGRSHILHADAFEWLSSIPENSLHAIVTDPPYGVKEYNLDQIEKRANGNGGIGESRRPSMVIHARRCPDSQH